MDKFTLNRAKVLNVVVDPSLGRQTPPAGSSRRNRHRRKVMESEATARRKKSLESEVT